MGAAERRKKVVQGGLIGEIHHGEAHNRVDTLCVQQVVGSNAEAEDVAGPGPGRIPVVVFGAGRQNVDPDGAIIGRVAARDTVSE